MALLVSPRLIVSMLCTEPRLITDVEIYGLRALGLSLLTLSAFTLLLTGLLPIAPPSSSSDKSNDDPYSFPTALTATFYHGLSAFVCYAEVTKHGFSFGYGSGLLFSTILSSVGIFSCLFGNERSRVSKTTGADKRTSNFPSQTPKVRRKRRRRARESLYRQRSDKLERR